MLKRLLLLAVTVALGACADPVDRSIDWNYLHATIIEPSCATSGCHSAMTANGAEDRPLDLSNPESAFRDLASDPDTTVECGSADELPVDGYLTLFPGQDAILIDFLQGEGQNLDYPQMPIDLPLTPAEVALIERWVEDGAPCE